MKYVHSESGAVTVDWVVLTAGLVGLGLATMSVVSTGVQDTSSDVEGQLTGPQIFTSFTQREHSGLYAAFLAFAEATTNPSWDGQGTTKFETFVADMKGYDDPTVAALEGMLGGQVAEKQTLIDAIDAAGDFEALSYGDMETITGVPAATIQANVEGAYGSRTAYLDSLRAGAAMGVAQHAAYEAEVALRGL